MGVSVNINDILGIFFHYYTTLSTTDSKLI